jgi:hypothetical protein
VDDVGIDCPGSGKAIISPDFLEQTVAAESFALVAKKVFEQLEFFRGEIKRFAGARNLATAEIHFNIAK